MNNSNEHKEIIKDVINIFDEIKHPNIKCQYTKEEWMNFCFHTRNKSHKTFLYYKGSQYCNKLFNDYYECFVEDKKIKLNKKQ